MTKRRSSVASGSSIVTARGSHSACSASLNATPCFRLFDAALTGSNSMSLTPQVCICNMHMSTAVDGFPGVRIWQARDGNLEDRKWPNSDKSHCPLRVTADGALRRIQHTFFAIDGNRLRRAVRRRGTRL